MDLRLEVVLVPVVWAALESAVGAFGTDSFAVMAAAEMAAAVVEAAVEVAVVEVAVVHQLYE